MKTEDPEVLGRELNKTRSKPDTVDRPVRTAYTFVHHYNSTHYCSTETVFFQYFPSSRPTSHLRCGQVEAKGKSNTTTATVNYTITQTVYVFSIINYAVQKSIQKAGV